MAGAEDTVDEEVTVDAAAVTVTEVCLGFSSRFLSFKSIVSMFYRPRHKVTAPRRGNTNLLG